MYLYPEESDEVTVSSLLTNYLVDCTSLPLVCDADSTGERRISILRFDNAEEKTLVKCSFMYTFERAFLHKVQILMGKHAKENTEILPRDYLAICKARRTGCYRSCVQT